eukprot:1854102-Heterocapsa_arctica.AAC.1
MPPPINPAPWSLSQLEQLTSRFISFYFSSHSFSQVSCWRVLKSYSYSHLAILSSLPEARLDPPGCKRWHNFAFTV